MTEAHRHMNAVPLASVYNSVPPTSSVNTPAMLRLYFTHAQPTLKASRSTIEVLSISQHILPQIYRDPRPPPCLCITLDTGQIYPRVMSRVRHPWITPPSGVTLRALVHSRTSSITPWPTSSESPHPFPTTRAVLALRACGNQRLPRSRCRI